MLFAFVIIACTSIVVNKSFVRKKSKNIFEAFSTSVTSEHFSSCEKQTKRMDKIKFLIKLYFLICTVLLLINGIILYYQTMKIYSLTIEQNKLDNCFISIDNFVTVRRIKLTNHTNQFNKNEFEMKTFAHSFTTPYLIELISNSRKDCICCPQHQ